MTAKAAPNPDHDAMLADLASLGMRVARVVTRMVEIEQQVAEIVAADLPEPGYRPQSITEAEQAGRDIDSVTEVMAQAVPHTEILARAYDRAARSVRFTLALTRRFAAGWPRAGSADNRQAMLKRQVARGVSEAIRAQAEGERAERYFDELAGLLDDPALEAEIGVLPEEEVIRRICCLLGLALAAVGGVRDTPPPVDTS